METYRLCPHCDYFSNIKQKEDYCPKCGERLLTQCPCCKKVIVNPYARYCMSCGAMIRKSRFYEPC